MSDTACSNASVVHNYVLSCIADCRKNNPHVYGFIDGRCLCSVSGAAADLSIMLADVADAEELFENHAKRCSLYDRFSDWYFEANFFEASNLELQKRWEFQNAPAVQCDSDRKCRRCGSTRAYGRGTQTRSCDEGATIIITCENCHARWRE